MINARVSRILNCVDFEPNGLFHWPWLFVKVSTRYFEATKFMHCIIFTPERILFNDSTLIIWASTLARKVNFEKKNWREIKGGSRCRLFVLDIWCHPTQHSRKLIFLSPLASLGSQCGWLYGQEISRIEYMCETIFYFSLPIWQYSGNQENSSNVYLGTKLFITFRLYFHPKHLKNERNDPLFNILPHTQSIVWPQYKVNV